MSVVPWLGATCLPPCLRAALTCAAPPPPPACAAGEDIPEWFAFKSVVSVLREAIAEESSASDTDSS